MEGKFVLSQGRELTEIEKSLVYKKPSSHIESKEERRVLHEIKRNWNNREMRINNILLEGDAGSGKTELAKCLSAELGLPYTKITCFADMDKSDIIGSILPIISEESENKEAASKAVAYKFYPSEIVRAFENGWFLEIQEPTVIRDAAVLMSLNSALEPDGTINLPTGIIKRHPDFIAVITTNRGYNGCRPLNESLRDRVQHTEKMDLPTTGVMMERAISKTGYRDFQVLALLAETIILLDKTAKANSIKGVSGMRSYLFWVDAVSRGADITEAMYHKVIYKITTDKGEILILENALNAQDIFKKLNALHVKAENKNDGIVMEIRADGNFEGASEEVLDNQNAIRLRKSADSEGSSSEVTEKENDETTISESSEADENGTPTYHELEKQKSLQEKKSELRKKLNQEAREALKDSTHEKTKLIVHRPESQTTYKEEYNLIFSDVNPIITEMVRKIKSILEHEQSEGFSSAKTFGTKFKAENLAASDLKYFANKQPPSEKPTLAVGLRIDESASMAAFGRTEAAKRAAVAVYEFCQQLNIPIVIYGDTADRSKWEQMSLFSYIDFEHSEKDDKFCLMGISGRSNNRDGMALRILSQKLLQSDATTKLLISISDGKPTALPDYSGAKAALDMQSTMNEFSRKGIVYLAAAIGQDKQEIEQIYGNERFIDISNLESLPQRLVSVIAKYML